MTEKRYPRVESGTWVQPVMTGYKMKCCDCGLVHSLDFRVVKHLRRWNWKKVVQFRAFRDDNETEIERHHDQSA